MNTSDAKLMLQLTLGSLLIITAGFVAVSIYAINDDGGATAPISSTLDINLEEFSITGDLVAPAGEVTLLVHNNGSMDHNLGVKELDLLTLDTADAPAVVEHAPDLLVSGGFVAVYSPFVESAREVVETLAAVGMDAETYETIQREMDFDERGTRPSTAGVGHTGYLVFARN